MLERTLIDGLSPREVEVFTGLLQGDSNKELAARLNIAEKTVHVHVSNILNKRGEPSVRRLLASVIKALGEQLA